MFGSAQPIEQVKVYVRDANSNTIIGQGITDDVGRFTINWSATPTPAQAHLTWHAEHGHNRFAIRSGSGGTWVMWTPPFTLVPSGLVDIGSPQWGNELAPHPITNIYDGGQKGWWDGLWWSSRLRIYFGGVEARFPSSACPTSCASCEFNLIHLDPGSAFSPQGRVMHELGHIATCRAHVGQSRWQGAPTDFDCPWCTDGWGLVQPEWYMAGFEEGLATFLGDVAFYGANAASPTTCISGPSACPMVFSLEASSGDSCSQLFIERRWPLSTIRALWDVFDTRQDCPPGFACDAISNLYDDMVEALHAFPAGRCEGCVHEGWTCPEIEEPGACWVDEPDGRSIYDYASNWVIANDSSIWSALESNCF
ncbi:MAG: hypothetical protein R6X02_17495 [Enhygromyxa sp.]